MIAIAWFLVLCFGMAILVAFMTYGWRVLLAYSIPVLTVMGIPALAYLYERDPEAYMSGVNMPYTILVYTILATAIIGALILFTKGHKSLKAQRESAVKRFRDIDGFYGGDDEAFMDAVMLCKLPIHAINPVTGKEYTKREIADGKLVAAWFMGPREIYDPETKSIYSER